MSHSTVTYSWCVVVLTKQIENRLPIVSSREKTSRNQHSQHSSNVWTYKKNVTYIYFEKLLSMNENYDSLWQYTYICIEAFLIDVQHKLPSTPLNSTWYISWPCYGSSCWISITFHKCGLVLMYLYTEVTPVETSWCLTVPTYSKTR